MDAGPANTEHPDPELKRYLTVPDSHLSPHPTNLTTNH